MTHSYFIWKQLLLLWGAFIFSHSVFYEGWYVSHTNGVSSFSLLSPCYRDIFLCPHLFINSLFYGCMIFNHMDVLELTHP